MKKLSLLILILLSLTLTQCNGQERKTGFDPKAVELNNKGFEFIKVQNYDSALFYLDEAIYVDTTLYVAHVNKFRIYLALKDYEKALTESQKATTIRQDLAEGWMYSGMLYEKLGDTSNALRCYRRSVQIFDERISNPDDADILETNKLNRAVALILMGQEEAGRSEVKKLKEDYPDDKSLDDYLTRTKKDFFAEIFDD